MSYEAVCGLQILNTHPMSNLSKFNHFKRCILHTYLNSKNFSVFRSHTCLNPVFWQLQNEEKTLDDGSAGHHHSTPKQSSVTLIEQIDEQLNYIRSDFTTINSVAVVVIIPVPLVNMISSSNCCATSRNFCS